MGGQSGERDEARAAVIDPASNRFPALLYPLLFVQGAWARARTLRLPEAAGPCAGKAGSGPDFTLVAIGDSIIAGVGVASTIEALPARLAVAVATVAGRTVHWRSTGRNGARTRDVLGWLDEVRVEDADLVVISNGLNDVTGRMAIQPWLEQKRRLYELLRVRAPGGLIAQLGLPPLGHFPALPQPLRGVLGHRARAFDQALATLVGTLEKVVYLPFRSTPEPTLFAADGYHPGPEAVGIWARALADMLLVEIAGDHRDHSGSFDDPADGPANTL